MTHRSRNELTTAQAGQNASLLLGPWAKRDLADGSNEEKRVSLRADAMQQIIAAARPAEGYRLAHAGRSGWLRRWKGALVRFSLQLSDSALAIGTGYPSVLGQGICLHRFHGVPIIPGSSIKGILLTWLQRCPQSDVDRWFDRLEMSDRTIRSDLTEVQSSPKEEEEPVSLDAAGKRQFLAKLLLGDVEHAAWVDLLDAWPDPADVHVHVDVITPHNDGYFHHKRADATVPELPVPVPFLVASGTFEFVATIRPMDPRLSKVVAEMTAEALQAALTKLGVGAKTSAGYGVLVSCTRRESP